MAAVAPRFLATGNVNPSVVVEADTSKNFHAKGSIANTSAHKPLGISQEGSYYPPGVLGSDGYAAHDGQPLNIFGEGEECLLKVGSGAGVTAGDDLTWDTTAGGGNAVTIAYTFSGTYSTSAGIWKVARALETANASELVRVLVQIQFLPEITA